MEPEVCSVTVGATPVTGALPATGAEAPWWVIGVALVVLVAGAALVALHRRTRNQRGAGAGAGAALVLGVALLASSPLVATTPAQASVTGATTTSVSYSSGCVLFGIEDVLTVTSGDVLPGDEAVVLTVETVNRFGGPVVLTAAAGVTEGSDALPGTLTTALNGTPASSVTVDPGARTAVGVLLAMPSDIGNDAQGLESELVLTITAVEE
ncbi:LPXTG cell wall anchor domain-containing protein [Microbacterium album]|uniref:LPXTG cell wall anchor domain-containing protein n=1 Tax=Microbacterium album TaxID=2053191 RepID=A0A917IEM1_9MICO|nr:LPXTG cell wall anchor domain-containing protein [Microbacterium album]GGH38754.1 hypothetical protein GCM10010921_09530 [Microbacterium album]